MATLQPGCLAELAAAGDEASREAPAAEASAATRELFALRLQRVLMQWRHPLHRLPPTVSKLLAAPDAAGPSESAFSAALREQWEAGVRDNELGLQKEALYVRNALEHSDALLGLIDRPKLLPLLTDIIGGDVQLRQVQVQSVMPTRDEAGGGYVNWHRDKGNYAHSTRSIWVKAFIYFSDVPADGGCTTVVPRTQNLDDSPPAGSYRGFGSSDGLTQEQMPGVSTQRCGTSSL